jgi:hypothetical protein
MSRRSGCRRQSCGGRRGVRGPPRPRAWPAWFRASARLWDDGFTRRRRRTNGTRMSRSSARRSLALSAPARSSAATTALRWSPGAAQAQNSANEAACSALRDASTKQLVSSTNLPGVMCQSMRDRLRPRSARAPRASSFPKLTRSSAISTASRSVAAPRETRASSSSLGSSQNALRTFPTREARPPELDRLRADRGMSIGTFRRLAPRWIRAEPGEPGEARGQDEEPTLATARLAPQAGLEPATLRLTAGCSAIELLRNARSRAETVAALERLGWPRQGPCGSRPRPAEP